MTGFLVTLLVVGFALMIPEAIVAAFVMDYQKVNDAEADTEMRGPIGTPQ